MNDILPLALPMGVGILLGAFFFGGLWWTVRKGIVSETPALWFIGSLILRTGVILVGFYYVAQGHWSRLAACLLGFLIARVFVMLWLNRAAAAAKTPMEKETHIAPHSR